MDMLGAILNNRSEILESLLIGNVNRINDPIGIPFESPGSRFFKHPALDQMTILQHPNQNLLDIACCIPSGPAVWILLAYGAESSKSPLGSDTALYNAIRNGRLYSVHALLTPGRSSVTGNPGVAWTPLLQAVLWNVPCVLRYILKRGASVHDAAPFRGVPGVHTALQICLNIRVTNYSDQSSRQKRNEVLKMLLDAGANIHAPPPEGSSLSPFEEFIEPWQDSGHWSMKLSCAEMYCLGSFVKKGANLQAAFSGSPCAALSSNTFEHQALWHSSPYVSDMLASKFEPDSGTDGSSLLHEIINSCSEAKRHPADTLRDIRILLQRGVDPNLPNAMGYSPLRKSLELCTDADMVPQLQALLVGGADPEHEDQDGIQVYTFAAQTLQDPLLPKVMQVLVNGIRGRQVRIVDGKAYTWAQGIFPVSEIKTYDKVVSCTKEDGDFMLSMKNIVPQDVQPAFQSAYFAIASELYFEATAKVVTSRQLSSRERKEIVSVISMRSSLGLPEHKFDQGLVLALLDCLAEDDIVPSTQATLPAAPILPTTSPTATATSPAYTPFQFNSDRPAITRAQPAASASPSPPETSSDFFIAPTTQIRWHDPCSASKPTDLAKAVASVLHFECNVCADGTLLTSSELARHEVEHAHSQACDGWGCSRRFCSTSTSSRKRKRGVGCPDHLLASVL
jgi:ankyrin repeat protein